MSMAVTYISAISFISGPAAVYLRGTTTFWWLVNCIVPAFPCAMFVLPMLFRLRPSNVFEVKFIYLFINFTFEVLCKKGNNLKMLINFFCANTTFSIIMNWKLDEIFIYVIFINREIF